MSDWQQVGAVVRRGGLVVSAPIAKASKAQITEAEALAASLEPGIAKAVRAYLDGLADGVDLQDLIDALVAGDLSAVMGLLAGVVAASQAGAGAIANALQDAVWAGGALAAATINTSLTRTAFVFGRLNPTLVTFQQNYSLGLIRQINDQIKETVRDALMDGVNSGAGPITTARAIKATIGLTDRQANAVKAYRKQLDSFHTKRSAAGFNLGAKIDRVNGRQVYRPDDNGDPKDGILERRLRDFRYDSQLQRAMDTGKPIAPAKVDEMVAAYARKYRRYRSEMIARTEALRATNYGVQDGWRQAIEGGKIVEAQVRRKWKVAYDERRCDVCSAVPGMNPKLGVKFDQPFATLKGPVMLPPLHPNCRCTVFIRQYEPSQLKDAP